MQFFTRISKKPGLPKHQRSQTDKKSKHSIKSKTPDVTKKAKKLKRPKNL